MTAAALIATGLAAIAVALALILAGMLYEHIRAGGTYDQRRLARAAHRANTLLVARLHIARAGMLAPSDSELWAEMDRYTS